MPAEATPDVAWQEPKGVDLDVPAGRAVQRQESDRFVVEDRGPVPQVGAVQVRLSVIRPTTDWAQWWARPMLG